MKLTNPQAIQLQTFLADAHLYAGKIDGLPGPMTLASARRLADTLEAGVDTPATVALPSNGSVLTGDGTWPWQAQIVGDDIVIFGYATCFGGSADPQDNGQTASGISTKADPNVLGCSLPMDGRKFLHLTAAEHRALDGCPLPRMPFRTTIVRVICGPLFQDLPVIDLGPGKQATHQANEPHVIDLTVAAARKFNPRASATNFMAKVEAVILGGAKYL